MTVPVSPIGADRGAFAGASDVLAQVGDSCSKSKIIECMVRGESRQSSTRPGTTASPSPKTVKDGKGPIDILNDATIGDTSTSVTQSVMCPSTFDDNGNLNLDFLRDEAFMNYSFEDDH